MNNKAKYKYLLVFLGVFLLPALTIAESQIIDFSELFKSHISNKKTNVLDDESFEIIISRVGDQFNNVISLGEYVTVPVILHSATGEITGFDILIGFDANALSFQAAFWGEEFGPDGCGWEYFTYRYGDPHCDNDCPSGLLRVTGIADINNGPHYPSCLLPDSLPTTLFSLDFLITNDLNFKCNYLPLSFFWLDCGDNALADVNHHSFMISGSVLEGSEYNIIDIFDSTVGYPTFRGAQDSCSFNHNWQVERSVTFQNGGIFVACPDSLIIRGDINLDEAPFEISDLVLFSEYFVYGLDVFTIDPERQIPATDINGDGTPLRIEDLVLMLNIIAGEVSPDNFDTTSPNIATIYKEPSGIISIETPDTLGAVYLTFSGIFTPTLLVTNPGIRYGLYFDSSNSQTRVLLIYTFYYPTTFVEGPLIANTENNDLVEVQVCTYNGAKINTVIDDSTDLGTDETPIFIDCPAYVNGMYFDTLFYQVKAIVLDDDGDDKCNDCKVRYHLISGPGIIDSRTGMWSWFPDGEIGEFSVEIAASIGNSQEHMTTGDKNCSFPVRIFNETGDVNLNGIPYEIGDAVVFSYYFIYGMYAFIIDTNRQIAATDVNGDGIPLKVEDLVLLIRIIVGDAQPGINDTTSPNIATFRQDVNGIVSVETPDTLGAVHFVFSGNITPALLVTNMDIIYAFIPDSSKTRVLVYSFDIENFTEGPILGNTGNASLIEVQTCTFEGAKINTVIEYSLDIDVNEYKNLPASFALYQNYPNPFNNETIITLDLPKKGKAKFEIINILGKVVYDWTKTYPAGRHQVVWDGINNNGKTIASGVYYYRLQAGDFIATKKMVLLK